VLPGKPPRSRSPEIASRQYEHSGLAGSQRRKLQRAISQSLILGEDDPAALAGPREPNAIFLIASEMLVVDFNRKTGLDEFRSDWLYAD